MIDVPRDKLSPVLLFISMVTICLKYQLRLLTELILARKGKLKGQHFLNCLTMVIFLQQKLSVLNLSCINILVIVLTKAAPAFFYKVEFIKWLLRFIFYKSVVFPAQAEYSYFSADFRLKIFLYGLRHFRFRIFGVSITSVWYLDL